MNLFLSFPGNAAEAMDFYLSVLTGAVGSEPVYYPDSNQILNVQMTFKGQTIMMMDVEDSPSFTWSASLYVETDSEAEFQTLLKGLGDGGTVLMGPEPAGIMALAAWVTDRFGLTWQLVWRG